MSKIMDKIAALLAKTVENGATEQEAIEAAKVAQRLMAKYHIEAVELQEKTENIDVESVDVTRNWQSSLAKVIADNTCCRVVRTYTSKRHASVIFFGRDSDRQNAIALWKMFAKLITEGVRAARQAATAKYGNSQNVEGAYAIRYIQAIKEEMSEQCRALALVIPEDVNNAVSAKFPKLSNRRITYHVNSGASYMASQMGYRDGKSAASRKRLG